MATSRLGGRQKAYRFCGGLYISDEPQAATSPDGKHRKRDGFKDIAAAAAEYDSAFVGIEGCGIALTRSGQNLAFKGTQAVVECMCKVNKKRPRRRKTSGSGIFFTRQCVLDKLGGATSWSYEKRKDS
jgi:hypothetical protein